MTHESNPAQVVCPACNAQPGQPCTRPTNRGRATVTWHHASRVDLATAVDPDGLDPVNEDAWHDADGNVWSSASHALDSFMLRLSPVDEWATEHALRHTHFARSAAWNLRQIASTIDGDPILQRAFRDVAIPRPGAHRPAPAPPAPRYTSHTMTGEYQHILGQRTHALVDNRYGATIGYVAEWHIDTILHALNEGENQ